MTNITCDKCKNANLISENGELRCPSCGAVFSAESESLLLGITLYNESKKEECENALMKALVKDGGSCEALIYKALAEALGADEDTVSFTDIYSRIISAFKTAEDCDLPRLLAVANDEMAKHEKALTELHVKAFETADAEKIKKEVEFILKIRDEALAFRNDLTQLAAEFNGRNESIITLNLSRGFYVSYELADEIGDKKLNKIKEDIASHTVFTGILSSDIKNLEIYYRCVVMFFEKSKAKYDFLISNAKKLAYLNGALESGKYANVASPAAAAEKLKAAAYNFFEESLKEYDDENEGKPSVIVTAPEKPEVEITAEVEIELEAATEAEINEEAAETAETSEAEAEEVEAEEAVEATAEKAEPDSDTEEPEKPSEENEAEEDFSAEESEEPKLEISIEVEIETAPEAQNDEEAQDKPVDCDAHEAKEAENAEEENANGTASSSAEVISAIDLAAQRVMKEITEQGDEAVTKIAEEPEEIISNSLSAVAAKHEASMLTEVEHKDEFKEKKEAESSESTEDLKSDGEEREKADTPEETAEDESSKQVEEKPAELETTLKPKKKKKHIGLIVFLLIIAAVLAFSGIKYIPGIISEVKYKSAAALLEDGSYAKAEEAFKALGGYKDSEDKAKESVYLSADSLCKSDDHNAAAELFASLGEYKDAVTRVLSCKYDSAVKTLNDGNFDNAAKLFEEIKDYGNSREMINECTYKKATALLEEKSYTDAAELFTSLGKYSDSQEKANEAKYQYVTENLSKDNKTTVAYITELAKAKYRNSAELKTKLLGEEKTNAVKLFVNTSADDLSTSLKSAAHTSELYFHIVCGEAYYGKSVTLSYTTQYGYTQSNTVTVSKNNSDDYITYPASNVSGYTVTFNAYDENGTSLGKVNFTVE